MSLPKLIQHFSTYEIAPVKVTDVRDSIIEYGVQDQIEFIEANFDPKVLKGVFRQFRHRDKVYSDPQNVVHIYYARQMSFCWHRFVCCKELMHVYDSQDAHTLSETDIASLVENLALNQNPAEGKIRHALEAEARAHLLALHILVPEPVLEHLRSCLIKGTVRIEDVAYTLRIPAFYVQFVFSKQYQQMLNGYLDKLI